MVKLLTPLGGTAVQVVISTLSYVGMAVASIFDEDIRNDMNAIGWNPFNSDANKIVGDPAKNGGYWYIENFKFW